MEKPRLTRRKMAVALVVAVAADVLQLPVTAAEFTGFLAIPGEALDLAIDVAAMIASTKLLGFHSVFLPSFVLEALPGVDLLPTWTASVLFVIAKRKREESAGRVIDIKEASAVRESPGLPGSTPDEASAAPASQRLR